MPRTAASPPKTSSRTPAAAPAPALRVPRNGSGSRPTEAACAVATYRRAAEARTPTLASDSIPTSKDLGMWLNLKSSTVCALRRFAIHVPEPPCLRDWPQSVQRGQVVPHAARDALWASAGTQLASALLTVPSLVEPRSRHSPRSRLKWNLKIMVVVGVCLVDRFRRAAVARAELYVGTGCSRAVFRRQRGAHQPGDAAHGMSMSQFKAYMCRFRRSCSQQPTALAVVGLASAVADALPPTNADGSANLAAQTTGDQFHRGRRTRTTSSLFRRQQLR